jgi:hypothetical protein
MKLRFATLILAVLVGLALVPQWRVLSSQLKQTTNEPPVYLPLVGYLGGSNPNPTPSPTGSPTSVPTLLPEGFVVANHNSVALFDQIPTQYREAAANLHMLYIDASVGMNISLGLDCLSTPSTSASSYCKRWEHVDDNYSVSPSEFVWPGTHNRSNWVYQTWVENCSTWDEKVGCFMNMVRPLMNQYQVVSYQFSYLDVYAGSSIADMPGGFFDNNPNLLDVYDLETFEAQNPGKVFIYWTTSLARSNGTDTSTQFNEMMRQYAIDNNRVLFDVADILSYTPDGRRCYDNRDGVPYDNGNNFENYPDDGQNSPAICQEYTTETDGGHLGSVSAGMIRVAKAYWVLMAQIAGWDPTP